MKKILLVCILLIPFSASGECNYTNEKNLTTLSLYVNYSYEYNEESGLFDISVYNLQDIFGIRYHNETLFSDNNKSIINNINPGKIISLEVFGTGKSGCPGMNFRTINITTPYLNPYYNSEECKNYGASLVCYSRFLNFEISYETFKKSLIREEEKNNPIKEKENTVFDEIINYIVKNYIKFALVIITSIFCIMFYKRKYRKSKHGI